MKSLTVGFGEGKGRAVPYAFDPLPNLPQLPPPKKPAGQAITIGGGVISIWAGIEIVISTLYSPSPKFVRRFGGRTGRGSRHPTVKKATVKPNASWHGLNNLPQTRSSRNRRSDHHTKTDKVEEAGVASVAGCRTQGPISADE